MHAGSRGSNFYVLLISSLTLTLVNIGIEVWGGVFCLVCLFCSFQSPYLETRQRHYIMMIFSMAALCLFGDAAAYHADGIDTALARIELPLGLVVSDVGAPILAYLYCMYQLGLFDPPENRKRFWLRVFRVLVTAAVVFTLIAPFTGIVFYIDENNLYHRTAFTSIHHLVALFIVLVSEISMILHRDQIPTRTFWTLTLASSFPLIGGLLVLISYGIAFGYISFTFSAVIVFIHQQFDAARTYVGKEAILQDNHAKLALANMRPNYMFDILNIIQYLCRTDPKKASKAISTFSTYLRGSINALKSDNLVTFNEELAQARSYIQLEQLSNPDLKVSWDIHVSDFMIPPLTLQSMAENSIIMGLRNSPKASKELIISSADSPEGITVTVQDNGIGFDPKLGLPTDGEGPYTAIEQTRTRLRHHLGASITLNGKLGEGATVTVRIPKPIRIQQG